METKQRTINNPVSISGVGLHTGREVRMTLTPAPENYGFKFQRTDIEGKPIIEADVDNVSTTERGTTLTKNNVDVHTVEHLLASFVGMSVDNVLVELDGPEVPILDGSSGEFVKLIEEAGIVEQNAERQYFEITSNIHYSSEEGAIEMIAMPLDSFRLTCMIDFKNPIIGSQHASISHLNEFKAEIASSRTFCLLTDVEELYNKDLIKGGDVSNAIVVVDKKIKKGELEHLASLFNKDKDYLQEGDDGILNNMKLRFQNEPARHKLLDMIGDLALVGMPLKAQIMAARPGHSANIEFAKKIKKAITLAKKSGKIAAPHYDPDAPAVYDTKGIEKLLPHRHPFLLVDKVIELTEKTIVGIKNVTYDEWFFKGHFPNQPVMPGVLMIEALAQCGGVLILHDVPDPENYSTLFLKIDKARFKGLVQPGDSLILKCELVAPIRRGVCQMTGKAFVGSRLVVEAELMAQVSKNQN